MTVVEVRSEVDITNFRGGHRSFRGSNVNFRLKVKFESAESNGARKRRTCPWSCRGRTWSSIACGRDSQYRLLMHRQRHVQRCTTDSRRRGTKRPRTAERKKSRPRLTTIFRGRLRSTSFLLSLRGWRSQDRGGSNPPFRTIRKIPLIQSFNGSDVRDLSLFCTRGMPKRGFVLFAETAWAGPWPAVMWCRSGESSWRRTCGGLLRAAERCGEEHATEDQVRSRTNAHSAHLYAAWSRSRYKFPVPPARSSAADKKCVGPL